MELFPIQLANRENNQMQDIKWYEQIFVYKYAWVS